jgi:hypothetical protein
MQTSVEHPSIQRACLIWRPNLAPLPASPSHTTQVPGSVLASPDLFLLWRPRTMAEVTPESLALLDVLDPPPEVGWRYYS